MVNFTPFPSLPAGSRKILEQIAERLFDAGDAIVTLLDALDGDADDEPEQGDL
jgi:hypothetical protein